MSSSIVNEIQNMPLGEKVIVILGSHQHHAVIQIQAKGLMAFEKRLQILIALSEQ